MPFGFGKLKVIADLDEQVQSSGRYRRETVISSVIEKMISPFTEPQSKHLNIPDQT